MCGIVATIIPGNLSYNYNLYSKLDAFFKQAMFADTLRGFDSTGIFSVSKKGEIDSYKRALAAPDFIQLKKTKSLIDHKASSFGLVGHNRASTRGETVDENAHPFSFRTVVGVHNGTLKNDHTFPTEFRYGVDSESLFAYLDGHEAVSVLEQVEGAYALIWYDSEDGMLKVTRNKERPLHYMKTDQDVLLIASEAGMLSWVAGRNGLKGEIKEYEEGVLYEYPNGSTTPSTKKYKIKKGSPPINNSYSYWGQPYGVSIQTKELTLFPLEFTPYSGKSITGKVSFHAAEMPKTTDTVICYGMTKEWFDSNYLIEFRGTATKNTKTWVVQKDSIKPVEEEVFQEKEWASEKCINCDAVIKEGEESFMTHNGASVCKDCVDVVEEVYGVCTPVLQEEAA